MSAEVAAVMELIELSNLSTHVAVRGDGPDLLWIAGGGYRGSDWQEHFVPAFEGRYRCITFDNRGTHGTTCSQELPWSIGDMAADAAELLERIGTGEAIVVGHSMGGAIGLQLALDRPDLVQRAVCLAAAADTSKHWVGDFMRAEIALRREGVRLPVEFAATHYAPLLYPAAALGEPGEWEKIKRLLTAPEFHENNEDTVETQWQACADFDVTRRMADLRVPVEFVSFEQDVTSPPALSRRSAALSRLARHHEIAGLGHCSLFGHRPEAVSQRLAEILASPSALPADLVHADEAGMEHATQ